MPKTPTETAYIRRLRVALERTFPDSFFFKAHGGPYQRAGLPDLIGCVRGRFVGIEIKRPGNRLTPLQVATRDTVERAQGVMLAFPTDLDPGIVALQIGRFFSKYE